jgi:glycosyltransferase involved in cell wall biosynthesis
MKVILSVDSVKFPLTGIGRYAYELAKHLELSDDLELLLFSKGNFIRDLVTSNQTKTNNYAWLRSLLIKSDLVVSAYRSISKIKSRNSLSVHSGAIFHGPGFYLPEFNGPSVATFHDLSIFTCSQYHPPERVRFMQRELTLTLERASMLITDSEYIRQELAAHFSYPLDKIRTISLACSSDFHPRDANDTNRFLSQFKLVHNNFTLYAGTIEPRKNIDALLDAYSKLPELVRKRWPLVLAGYHGWQSEKLHARIKDAECEGWLIYLGYVLDEDLPLLFSAARLFVFPSHYEGFGLPVLESMASGVPVICSNSSSLPEVVGNAALMCDPLDVEMLGQLIKKGLEDENWRTDAVIKGLNQSSKFSWHKCAQDTVTVYHELEKNDT